MDDEDFMFDMIKPISESIDASTNLNWIAKFISAYEVWAHQSRFAKIQVKGRYAKQVYQMLHTKANPNANPNPNCRSTRCFRLSTRID